MFLRPQYGNLTITNRQHSSGEKSSQILYLNNNTTKNTPLQVNVLDLVLRVLKAEVVTVQWNYLLYKFKILLIWTTLYTVLCDSFPANPRVYLS